MTVTLGKLPDSFGTALGGTAVDGGFEVSPAVALMVRAFEGGEASETFNIELESGDDLLLESGDLILME